MNCYEHTFITKQDLPESQAKKVINKYEEIIKKNSGKIISNVNKKLDYLVVGEKPTTKKINNAKKLNVNVINQEEWEKMLNKTS